MFHFGILFENPSFEMKLNGKVVCPKGSRPYLFLENNGFGQGVTFLLTDKAGKEKREKGNKPPFIGVLTTYTEPVPFQAGFSTVMQVCQEENTKKYEWLTKDIFAKDPEFLKSTRSTHTNCKRFALKVWEAANLEVP